MGKRTLHATRTLQKQSSGSYAIKEGRRPAFTAFTIEIEFLFLLCIKPTSRQLLIYLQNSFPKKLEWWHICGNTSFALYTVTLLNTAEGSRQKRLRDSSCNKIPALESRSWRSEAKCWELCCRTFPCKKREIMAMAEKGCVDDLATLSELNEEIILQELQARYRKDIIYVRNGMIRSMKTSSHSVWCCMVDLRVLVY